MLLHTSRVPAIYETDDPSDRIYEAVVQLARQRGNPFTADPVELATMAGIAPWIVRPALSGLTVTGAIRNRQEGAVEVIQIVTTSEGGPGPIGR